MKKYLPSLFLIIFILGLWEGIAQWINLTFIFPAPTHIGASLWELKTELFYKHLPSTLLIILIGLILSIILGVSLAILMHFNRWIEQALYPLLLASQTIPVIALAPIFVLWFGYSIWSKVMMTLLLTFFPITISTIDGLRASSKAMEELFLTLGAKRKDIFIKLQLPNALPHFFSGLKIAIPLSVIGAAIGEWLGAQAGLGYFSRRMMTQFDGAAVFAPIVLLSVVGIIIFLLALLLERRILKWRN